MPRPLRIEYEGAVYHVMNRGDRREPIFRDDADRLRFLDTLAEACAKTGWQVHALCLMPNHFHLVVETPRSNLVAGMKWFLGTYTARFNRRHGLAGHLFGGRYKALLVDSTAPGYFRAVCDYVHLNPARANLIPADQPLREYRWSSHAEYLKAPTRRWPWLQVDRLPLADHAPLNPRPWPEGTLLVVVTEKDAVKCSDIEDPRIWVIPMRLELPSEFSDWVQEVITRPNPYIK